MLKQKNRELQMKLRSTPPKVYEGTSPPKGKVSVTEEEYREACLAAEAAALALVHARAEGRRMLTESQIHHRAEHHKREQMKAAEQVRQQMHWSAMQAAKDGFSARVDGGGSVVSLRGSAAAEMRALRRLAEGS